MAMCDPTVVRSPVDAVVRRRATSESGLVHKDLLREASAKIEEREKGRRHTVPFLEPER